MKKMHFMESHLFKKNVSKFLKNTLSFCYVY